MDARFARILCDWRADEPGSYRGDSGSARAERNSARRYCICERLPTRLGRQWQPNIALGCRCAVGAPATSVAHREERLATIPPIARNSDKLRMESFAA